MTSDFQVAVGATVQWTKVRHGKSSINFSHREGVVQKISGGIASVKGRNGRVVDIEVAALEDAKLRTAITRMMFPDKGPPIPQLVS